LNKPALAFVPLDEQARTAAAIQRAFTEGYAELDGQLLTKDLRTIPYHWTGALLKNDHGEPIGITGVGRDVSEKKQAEEELTQQRRHLIDAQALAHLGSWDWDIDTGEVQWSDEQFRIFGHEPEATAVTYDTFLASLHPNDRASVLAAINDALLGERVYDVEYRIVRPNGEVRFIHALGDVYRDATGHPLSMAGTVLDITERKRIEDALRASEERWHLAVRGSNDGIWDWNIQTGDIFFSSRWKAMRGYQDNELADSLDEWRSRIHPDDLDRVLQSSDAYLAKQRPEFCEEYRVQRKDGSYMWVLDRGVALWADDGTPLRMVGSESDITEHRQALLRLAEQESLLRSILDAEPECVKRVAADGTLLQMNEAGLCFIETDSFEQVAGRSVYDLVAPEFLELYRSMHEAVIQGASQQLEFQIVGLKGTRRWMETHAVPLQNPIDHCVEHLAVTRDISERKRAEEALRESEERFALAVEGSTDILWDAHRLPGEPWYAPQTPIWWSPRVRELLGLEESESFETLEQWAGRLHPDDKDRVFGQLAAHIEHRVPYDAEYRLRNNRGDYRWIRGRGQAMWDEQGEIRRMSGSCQDITDRKFNEQLLAAEKRILEMIATDTPLQEVLTLMCRMIEELSPGAHCSILLLDRDGLHLRHGAAPSLPEAYVHAIDGVAIGPTVGSCGTAAFMRRQVIVSDIARDPLWADFRDLALRHGFRACWSTPVISSDGTVLGTFAVYYREPQQPTHADLRLIERTAQIACIAIEHKQTAKQLVEAYSMLHQIVANIPLYVFWKDRESNYLGCNRFVAESAGVGEPAAIVGKNDYALAWRETAELYRADDRHVMETNTPKLSFEEPMTRPDGSVLWLRTSKVPLQDRDGKVFGVLGISEDITEHKRTEEALQMQASVLRSMLEGVSLSDENGVILYTNPAEDAIFGYKPGELIGKHVAVLNTYPPEENVRIVEGVIEQLKAKGSWKGEFSNRRKDGSPFTTFAHITALELSGKKHWVCVQADITERKQAEESLRVSEERFNLAVRGSNTGIWDWDLRTNKTYLSPLWKSMLGHEEHELRGEFSDWEERLHPDDRERSLATVRAYLDGTTPQYELEHRLRHKDGNYRWILARGVSISDAEGNPYRMAGSHIDITEQKQTQDALAQSERQLRTVLDALPVGVWFTDQFGKPLLANPAAKQIWSGIRQVRVETSANAAGWWEAIGPSSELHRWALSHALTKGVPSLYESLEFECLDGTKKTIRNSTVPVQDEAGNILGAIVLNEDITTLRQAQEALMLTQFSVDCAVEGFLWIGPDARILNVNEAACRLLEYTRDELTAMTLYDIDPIFSPEVWPAHWEELKQKGSLTFESKHWSKTGRVLDIEITVSYLRYEGNEYNCAIMRDIGERKRANVSLRQSEERYRSLVDNAPIGIFVNEDGRFAYVNRELQRILNATSAEQLIGTTVFDRIAPEFHQMVKARISQLMDNGQPVPSLDEQYVRLDGSRVDVAVTAIPTSFDGTPVMQVLVLDIAERKHMEKALRQRERDLRAAIEERERISQDLHDGILQSLFAIGLTLETTKLMMSPKKRKMSGPAIDQAIDQLNRVMHEIRNFIAGLGSDLLQGGDLPMALQHMLASLTENQATRVRLAVEDRAAQAVSSEQSLHLLLVIQEAVSNCIRHGHAQEATVSLKMLKQGVRLSVRDNGRGFNPEAAKGTGHGLRNMAARAQKIGGRFTVMSKVNEGTRIVLDLPKEASDVLR
jgi:PAS domain S-box-containing protein